MPGRLQPIPIEEIEDPDIREQAKAIREQTGDETFIPTLGPLFPDLMKSFFDFYGQFYEGQNVVDVEILELMRIKCYDFNECRL